MPMKDFFIWKRLKSIDRTLHDINARFASLEQLVVSQGRSTEKALMATRATDQALIAEVHRNTDVAKAANTAMAAQTAAITDLSQKLADAIANSDAADDPDVKAALDELKANNDAQIAATPALAQAVANTDAKAPVPTV